MERVKRNKIKAENQRLAHVAEFEFMNDAQLMFKKEEYLKVKKLALERGKKGLAALCNERLRKIEGELERIRKANEELRHKG